MAAPGQAEIDTALAEGFGSVTNWLTAAQAAEYISVSEPIIRDAVKKGDLPAYPVGKGREYRLTADEIDAWMMSRSWEPRQSA